MAGAGLRAQLRDHAHGVVKRSCRTPGKPDVLEQRAQEHQEDERSGARNVLALLGQSLMLDRDGLGFDRLCDLLNIHTVERGPDRRALAARGQEWRYVPLFNACHTTTPNFIKESS